MAETGFIDEIKAVLKECKNASQYAFVTPENTAAFFASAEKTTPKPAAGSKASENTADYHTPKNSAAKTAAACPRTTDFSQLSLDDLSLAASSCTGCRLHPTRHNVVFGEGNPNAELMFIGEGPGYDEDMQGRPFVGKAGQLLDKMITAMQFARSEVYIANIVKCRPPENRNPEPDEAAACLPYLRRQIELISPRVIVLLGSVPLEHLLGQKGIRRLRGQWLEYNNIPVMPTYHPAYLLRYPEAKKETWSDLQQVMKVFGKVHNKQ